MPSSSTRPPRGTSARHTPQERAIRLKPRVIETLNSLASAYTQRGRLADALATYREILSIDPDQATTTTHTK